MFPASGAVNQLRHDSRTGGSLYCGYITRAAKNAGIVMAVCCLPPAVREVFQVSGFDRLIPVKETVAEAMTA